MDTPKCEKCGGLLRWYRFNDEENLMNPDEYVELPQCIICGKVYYDTNRPSERILETTVSDKIEGLCGSPSIT